MRSIRIIVSVSLVCLFCSLTGKAQTTTSNIEGTVKDAQGAVVSGAQIIVTSPSLATERTATSDENGFYRIAALPAGTYAVSVSQSGFANRNLDSLELTLNRNLVLDVQLEVGTIKGDVQIASETQAIDPTASSTGATITPQQIQDLPVNGRDYLDLLQLVPGVAINRQADPRGDNATPVLGERGGNNNFFIDGHPNKDTVSGGPAAQFNQETIAEFQVLTTGYKAEFGQASGAIVNVITKSGGNEFHGVGSLFFRDDTLDSTNSLDTTREDALPLRRFDYSLAGGGPIIKDKWFFFGSAERITERRQLDFRFPDTGNALVNGLLRAQEEPFDVPSRTTETRAFLKFNQQLGRHQLSQELNYTNGRVKNFLPLAAASSLPSARNDSGGRRLLLAFGDTVLLGDQGNPYILTLRGAYRGEKSDAFPSQTTLGGATLFVPFDAATCTFATCTFAGNLPLVSFGNARTPSNLDQKYTSFNANVNKRFGDHDLKFGLNFLRTVVDGLDTRNADDQLFATTTNFALFGAGTAGPILRRDLGGITPAGDEFHLRNNYTALYVQDDWKIRNNLTLNLGVRWDYDSEFKATRNFAPRLGVAWAITPKTVLRANFGIYYDQFRLGLARDVPEFGGTDQRFVQYLLFPRGAYASPSFITSLPLLSGFRGACFSNGLVGNLTDAQIAAAGATCPFVPGLQLVGVDRFNNIVAPGRSPIPANTVITVNNVQALTGLTPEQYATQASASIGQPGLLFFTPSGFLGHPIIPPQVLPTTLDGTFDIPHTLGFNIGVQREIGRDMVLEVDYFHRDIKNLLGVRNSNLAFESRVLGSRFLPPSTTAPITTFGPFFEGQYDALILNLNKRLSRRFTFGANYTFANATDNSLGIGSEPSDAFIGIVPEVTEPSTGRSNRDGPFTRANGRLVQQAGTFLNGPDRDKGPSDLALDHIFQVNGLVDFPWQIQVSGIFRAQSGFHFSRSSLTEDPDGNGRFTNIDLAPGRNAFTAPAFVSLDMRFAKRFGIGERVKVQLLFEFFNLLNRQNPAAVERLENITGQPFGGITQVLPGREGQIGFKIEF